MVQTTAHVYSIIKSEAHRKKLLQCMEKCMHGNAYFQERVSLEENGKVKFSSRKYNFLAAVAVKSLLSSPGNKLLL